VSTAALILAGGTVEDPDAWGGVKNRALVEVGGKTLLTRVADAVRAAVPGRVLVAGDVPLPPGCVPVAGGATLLNTLLSGVAALEPGETRLLIVTADLPFLTPEAVKDILNRAPTDAAFVYPIVEAVHCYERFPQMKRTTVKTAQGTFTGGNLALIDAGFARSHETTIRAAYSARKSPLRLAGMLGWGTILRFALSPLTPAALPIPHLERAVGILLGGVEVRALITPYPEIGADLDRPEELSLVRALLESESRA
jgi:CMP-2-keto-3-deoxyoctulosonic acid synthetase